MTRELTPAPNLRELAAFLKNIRGIGGYGMVAIPPDGSPALKTFDAGQEEGLIEWVRRKNEGHNIYFHVNTVHKNARNRKAKKEEIVEVVALHTDVDDLQALKRIRDFRPRPSVIVHSGGGFQAYWLLGEPSTDFDRVERINAEIARQLGGDHTHNVDRILRAPGTLNWPNKKKRQAGRKPALSYVVEESWSLTYTLDDFSEGPEPAGPKGSVAISGAGAKVIPAGLEVLPSNFDRQVRRILETGDDPDRPIGTESARFPSRSEAVYRAACELARAGVPEQVIAGILTNPNLRISQSILERKDANRHALKQARAAYAAVAAGWPDADRNGGPRPTMRNAATALRRLGLTFHYDLFRNRKMVSGHTLEEYAGEISDDACMALRGAIIENFGFDPGSQNVFDAVSLLCLEHAYHPIREMLDGLSWDGTPRLDSWLSTYLGAEDTPLNSAIGTKFLIAAVRRARFPGTKFDQMLVLEGLQGSGKSSATAILAGAGNHSDQELLTLDSKAQMEMLDGVWIYEIGEVEGMSKAEVNRIKAFVSRTADRARMAYGRHSVTRPRQAVFIGTTNEDKYLRDQTGNRRFWPVKTGSIHLDALKRDRDQIWAEAAYRETMDESIALPPELWEAAAAEQAARLEDDPWIEKIEAAVPHIVGDTLRHYTQSLLTETLEISPERQNQGVTKRLATLMVKLGWKPQKFNVSGRTPRGYEKPKPEGYMPPHRLPDF